jgi:hypothetical protein
MRTAGVKRLVEQVLKSLPKPHTEDVIDDVFHAIEHRSEWRQEYDDLSTDLGKTVVNTWGGFWIASSEGRSGVQQVPARKSTLIDSYSKLTDVANRPGKKIKEHDALTMMSDYFQKNRTTLPASIVRHRELILELLMEGFTAEEAFSKVNEMASQSAVMNDGRKSQARF